MFKKIFRKVHFRNWSEEDKEIGMLLWDSYKMQYLATYLILFLVGLPFVEWLTVLILYERTLSGIITSGIILLLYIVCAIYFMYKFREPIEIFTHLVASTGFFSRYVVKGDAISKEDFDTMREKKENLYRSIAQQQCRGACYNISFNLLQCLKKGTMQFTAIKSVGDDECEHYYTMHVFWVNNEWCFDTYSGRQWPLEYMMKCCQGKVCTIFSYEDVQGKNYNQFMKEHNAQIEKWCKENDCEYAM